MRQVSLMFSANLLALPIDVGEVKKITLSTERSRRYPEYFVLLLSDDLGDGMLKNDKCRESLRS